MLVPRPLDPKEPGAVLPALSLERVTGVLEVIVRGHVSYLRFEEGRFANGYYCEAAADTPAGQLTLARARQVSIPAWKAPKKKA